MVSIIIVFALLILGVIIWQISAKKRFLRLSHQELPEFALSILITKEERQIDKFIVRIQAKSNVAIEQLKIELISKTRVFSYILSNELSDAITFPLKINDSESIDLEYDYENLKKAITTKALELQSFRIVIGLQKAKLYKSHELKFDKFWKIFKSDSGRYN
jgi:hypothetical protein